MNNASLAPKPGSSNSDALAAIPDPKIRAAQIQLLYKQGPFPLGSALIVACATIWLLRSAADHHLLLLWIGCIVAVTVARALLLVSFNRTRPTPDRISNWGTYYSVGTFLGGGAWGLLALIWDPAWPIPQQVLMYVVLAGISAGAISTYSTWLISYFSFVVPTLLPLVVVLLLRPEPNYEETAAIVIIYAILISVTARRYEANLRESLKLRFENLDLMDGVSHANEALRDEIDVRKEAQTKLQQLNETLERRVKERTQALAESEKLFRTITSSASEAIIMINNKAEIVYWNKAAENIFGYSAAEAVGRDAHDLLAPSRYQTAYHKAFIHFSQTGEGKMVGKTAELESKRRDGNEFPIELSVSAVRLNESWHSIGIVRDISERKRSQKEQQMLEIQLRHAQKLEAIGQLAAGISHEINTPVQFVSDNIRFLCEVFDDVGRLLAVGEQILASSAKHESTSELIANAGALAEEIELGYLMNEIPKTLDQTMEGVVRISQIVHAMKEFSHPGSDVKTSADINKAIETTVQVSRNEWKYYADLVTELDPDLPKVPCLPGEFNQVLLNVIVNAAHAIADAVRNQPGSKGTITIRTRRDDAWIEISINDTGTGIPQEIRSKIFDPFFTTKEVGRGTGQGLAIAYSTIVDKHGGTIHVDSEIGEGSTFYIRLPLSDTSAQYG